MTNEIEALEEALDTYVYYADSSNDKMAVVVKAAQAHLHHLKHVNPHVGMDDSPAVAYEDGYQVANKEWRAKIYKQGGGTIIKKLLQHYKLEHLLQQIVHHANAASKIIENGEG